MHEEQMPTIRQSVMVCAVAVGTSLICLMWVGVSLISVCAVLLITSLRFLRSKWPWARKSPSPRS
jgi:uncharacterized membrane protein